MSKQVRNQKYFLRDGVYPVLLIQMPTVTITYDPEAMGVRQFVLHTSHITKQELFDRSKMIAYDKCSEGFYTGYQKNILYNDRRISAELYLGAYVFGKNKNTRFVPDSVVSYHKMSNNDYCACVELGDIRIFWNASAKFNTEFIISFGEQDYSYLHNRMEITSKRKFTKFQFHTLFSLTDVPFKKHVKYMQKILLPKVVHMFPTNTYTNEVLNNEGS